MIDEINEKELEKELTSISREIDKLVIRKSTLCKILNEKEDQEIEELEKQFNENVRTFIEEIVPTENKRITIGYSKNKIGVVEIHFTSPHKKRTAGIYIKCSSDSEFETKIKYIDIELILIQKTNIKDIELESQFQEDFCIEDKRDRNKVSRRIKKIYEWVMEYKTNEKERIY